jgi:hypothetical protein
MIPETKLCGGCQRTLPMSAFPPRRSTAKAGGWRPWRASHCRSCLKKVGVEWRLKNPGRQAALTKAWRERTGYRRRKARTPTETP